MCNDDVICYEHGEVVFEEGSVGKEMYTIVSGKVAISKRMWDEKEATIAVLKEGDLFGEMAAFTDAPRSATAKAAGRTMLMSFSAEQILQRIQTNPEFAVNILQTLVARLRNTTSRLRAVMVRIYTAGMTAIPPEESPLLLGEILVEMGCLTESQLGRCLRRQKDMNALSDEHKLLGEIMTQSDIIANDELDDALAEQQRRKQRN